MKKSGKIFTFGSGFIVGRVKLIWFDLIWCNYLSRFAEKQWYACQATPLQKITEHDKKNDIRERNRIGQERERSKETVEKQQVNYNM